MLIPTPTSGEISLYFHLPFCNKKCDYCHFYVVPNKDAFKNLLKEALLKEIEMKSLLFKPLNICSLYFGGGTPALVGPDYLFDIIQKIKEYTSLDDIEITLEINPENNSLQLLKAFHQIGINRLSIGAQSFDDTLLKKLNRRHSSKEIFLSIENAKKAGFDNISIDLMYELPDQTLKTWQETLHHLSEHISHISLYNLSIEPHTVFYKYKKQIEKKMPSQKIAVEMFQRAKSVFEKMGFLHYEISAFCKKELYSKHNSGYWHQRPHLGFGPSSFSFFNHRRFQNTPNLNKYSKSILQNEDPLYFEESLSSEQLLSESLALHLRLIEGFNLEVFEKRFGKISSPLEETLQKLINDKLLIKEKNILKLSSKGLLFHDAIASEII